MNCVGFETSRLELRGYTGRPPGDGLSRSSVVNSNAPLATSRGSCHCDHSSIVVIFSAFDQ